MVDIVNTYLNAKSRENIYTRAGTEFELVVNVADKTLLEVTKEIYIFTMLVYIIPSGELVLIQPVFIPMSLLSSASLVIIT